MESIDGSETEGVGDVGVGGRGDGEVEGDDAVASIDGRQEV